MGSVLAALRALGRDNKRERNVDAHKNNHSRLLFCFFFYVPWHSPIFLAQNCTTLLYRWVWINRNEKHSYANQICKLHTRGKSISLIKIPRIFSHRYQVSHNLQINYVQCRDENFDVTISAVLAPENWMSSNPDEIDSIRIEVRPHPLLHSGYSAK